MAVYFVRPTRENIDKICQDCQAQLYSSFYFNFISPISRSLLEDLARAAVTANCVDQIAKVSTPVNGQSEESYMYIDMNGAKDLWRSSTVLAAINTDMNE